MGDFCQSLVVDVFGVFQLPCNVEGDMYGPGADGEGGGDVALQRVANHEQFGWVDGLVLAESEELPLGLVGSNLHVVEILQ